MKRVTVRVSTYHEIMFSQEDDLMAMCHHLAWRNSAGAQLTATAVPATGYRSSAVTVEDPVGVVLDTNKKVV